MKLDISNKLQTPQQLHQVLRNKVFMHAGQGSPDLAALPFSSAALQQRKGLAWREGVQLSPGLAVAQILEEQQALLVVLPSYDVLYQLHDDVAALGLKALVFPHWGRSLYKGIRSQTRLFAQRSAALAQICFWQQQQKIHVPNRAKNGAEDKLLVLTTLRSMAPVLPPPEQFQKHIVKLELGRGLQPAELAQILRCYGYYKVPRVSLPGEFALRGEVLDFCPPREAASLLNIGLGEEAAGKKLGESWAVRVMFGFDEIEMLKIFDTSSQISHLSIAEFPLFPLKEVLWLDEQQAQLREYLEQLLLEAQPEDLGYSEEPPNWDDIWQDQQEQFEKLLGRLAMQQEVVAEELLFRFACKKAASLQDYMGVDCPLLFWGYQRIQQQEESYLKELQILYQESLLPFTSVFASGTSPSKQSERLFPELAQRRLLHPEQFAVDLDLVRSRCTAPIVVDEFEGEAWPLQFDAIMPYHGNLTRFSEDLKTWLEQGYYVAIGTSSPAQAQRLLHILQDYAEELHFFSGQLSEGLLFPEQNLVLLNEWELLGGNGSRSKRSLGLGAAARKRSDKEERITKRLSQSEIISSFVELKEGDLVVHIQHGIGRFKGIERISTSHMERDYLALEYSDDNTLFVPIEQVNMVQRYIGNENANLRLDRIGGKAWQERKAKTQKAVEDLADRLLRLYTRRASANGFCCPPDDDLMEEFEADFPYEPTVDQLRAVAEIKQDLESPKPMDRLLCGDVGFGKTEVAMRASFKVAAAGRQVLLLCPTTILAEQHHQNFSARFARFPLRIAMLSRFVERKEQKAVLAALERGEVDILIGTHRILSKDIHLQNLGLVVVDEEQRFGVKDKERLKILKTSVDSLSMSATPIPRTLHMSLVQIRDISMLTTAPSGRHPVETFVREFNPESIANAIRRELNRGGQVFYLHNRIEGLEEILLFLRDLIPEALVEMAHGQMDSKVLEDIMYRFVHRGFNVLLATTIIENGIDIPNVNTIIIDRADRYGIGQLYQLRGRVGRSDQLAYAYLFYPDRIGLSDLALKRLKIISDFTELGSGFKVAMKDLEVRGAGNLLGPEQSGNIISVGFEMYSSMLAKAMSERSYQLQEQEGIVQGGVGEIQRQSQPEDSEDLHLREEISLELDYSGFIPDHYIPDATEKIDLYKRISLIDRAEMITDFYEELFDRFGTPPEEVNSLLSLAEVRIICRQVGINFLKELQGKVELQFSKSRPLPLEKIMQQIQRYPKIFRLDPKRSDALFVDLGAFAQSEEQRQQASKTGEQAKGQARKHSRNANYLQAEKEGGKGRAEWKREELGQESSVLLQKTAALRKVLSSFQG